MKRERQVWIALLYSVLLFILTPLIHAHFSALKASATVYTESPIFNFILPHSLFNLHGFSHSLYYALSTASVVSFVLGLLPYQWACACTWLFLSVTTYFSPVNFKIPFSPLSLWPQLLGSMLAVNSVQSGGAVDMASLRDFDLDSLQRFTDISGLRTLSVIQGYSSLCAFLYQAIVQTSQKSPGLFCLVLAGLSLDIVGLYLKARHMLKRPFLSSRCVKLSMIAPLYYVICLSIGNLYLARYPSCTMKDEFSSTSVDYSGTEGNPLVFTRTLGRYETQIAMDIYLPRNLILQAIRGEARTPTFFCATRYNRRMILRWPISGLLSPWGQSSSDSTASIWTWALTQGLLRENIPVVVLDARGTGASTGGRPIDLDIPEIEDFQYAVEWIRQQFWSNGFVAGGGVSYDGLTSLKLAGFQREKRSIDALVTLFSPCECMDFVRNLFAVHPRIDLIQQNGLLCDSFVRDYGGLTRGFELHGNPIKHWLVSSQVLIPLHVKLGVSAKNG